ncbi:hypothetical protein SLS62_005517 [Diatrype stigma]|uniref:Ricin B lectin domain-containing protein n=1 Tax=Diatrype stigma TaxID=117547 RepID=A0AAN9V0G2_9PEZI
MFQLCYHVLAASLATGVVAGPALTKAYAPSHRAVAQLNEAAAAEAHPRDETAVRAFAGTQIKTFDGKCLFVDKLSGDFRANLTPIQVTDCDSDSTDGQGWDVIVNGTHNDIEDSMLVVSTLPSSAFSVVSTPVTSQASLTSSGATVSATGSSTTAGIVKTTLAATDMPNPTNPVPVSGAGGILQPTAAAESHERDDTAARAFTAVGIQASDGRCLFIDPTAGDFRQNLIPISLVRCGGTPNEKFDVITTGKHNNAPNSALLVSSLMNGCISFDGRRKAGDTVTIFSCGGRADGSGETNNGQLFPYISGTALTLAPSNEGNATCVFPGEERLTSGPCTEEDSQVFTILS